MPYVETTDGQRFNVDPDLLPILDQFKWRTNNKGQAERCFTLAQLVALLSGADLTGKQVTFRDHNPRNCRRSNLLALTPREMRKRKRKQPATSSQYIGVDKCRGRWRASITFEGRAIHVGMFEDEESAARARDAMAKKLSAHYRLNFE